MAPCLRIPAFLCALAAAAVSHAAPVVDTSATVHVLGVTVHGNKTTRERVVLREMVIAAGDTMSLARFHEKLERCRQNLMNTGLFNTVTMMPVYLDTRNVLVEVLLNERWYIWPSPIFELADPNFNTWWLTKDFRRTNYGAYLYHYNFRGRNETLYVMAQFGYTRRFGLRYTVPFFDKAQRWGLSVGARTDQQAEVTAGTAGNKRILLRDPDGPNRESTGADLELTLRRAHDVRHAWRIGWHRATVADTVVRTAADYFNGAATETEFMALAYTFIWDRRDLRMFTRAGHYLELRARRLGLGLAGRNAPDITTLFASGKRWWRTGERVTLALSLRGKATFGTPPYYVQEGLGYGQYVRGHEYYVVDGEHFALGRANFLFQLIAPRDHRLEVMPLEAFRTLHFALYLNLFADAGRVWDSRYAERNFLANEWMGGYGAGLDLVSSYDQVVRAEYTLNAL
ncbi:MAG: BamA/TamA family outer membrane protein, partial [Flavobacteriales bacterium]|nr:BamA/TamA family outer membrane protein [Flavobacteriales bacterium]